MKIFNIIILGFSFVPFFLSLHSCSGKVDSSTKEQLVLIETDYGNIKVKLYNETPNHRDNFLKLVNDEFYNDIIFHRVISNFMIQGGDPTTKTDYIDDDKEITDAGYLLDAEFVPSLFHKRGALAAARTGDAINPEKKSSGSQFYIVQGNKFTNEQLDEILSRKNDNLKNNTINNLIITRANALMDKGITPDFNKIHSEMEDTINLVISNLSLYEFSSEQIETYTSIGGSPHLDGDYSVFGEVIEGIDVVDKIASVETDSKARPIKDIRMKMKIITHKE